MPSIEFYWSDDLPLAWKYGKYARSDSREAVSNG
jgi:hypothetical protein